jgi:hypothetical protein
LEREFNWSEDTAERLIAVYKLQRQIPQVAELSIPLSGLYILAARSTPPEAIEAIVAKAEGGEQVTFAGIKETIQEAKAPRKPKLPSYIAAEGHELAQAQQPEAIKTESAQKYTKAVTPADDALFAFTKRVLDLIRRIAKHRPDRFAKTAVGADDLARLGKFFTDLAQLKKEDWAAS